MIPLRLMLLNYGAFQAGWFGCVWGAGAGLPWLGPLVVLGAVVLHLWLARRPGREAVLLAVCALTGMIFDSALLMTGWVSYPNGAWLGGLAPYWIITLWIAFGATLNLSMGWLRGRPWLSLAFGAIGGPASYYAGEALGAIDLVQPTSALIALAVGWGLILPLLFHVAGKLDGYTSASLPEFVQAGSDLHSRPGAMQGGGLKLMLAVFSLVLAGQVFTLRADSPSPQTGPDAGEWRFRVFLDDKEIGRHDFYLEKQGPNRVLHTTAEFEYKLLFVKLYEYQHENSEVWRGDCLEQIESSTDANGKPFAVRGEQEGNGFAVQAKKGETRLPACVMSFAYWNHDFLKQTHLLNSQDGEYLEVEVSSPVLEELQVRGKPTPAWRYHLAAGPLRLELWYSEDYQWLGLASTTESGRVLRYELL